MGVVKVGVIVATCIIRAKILGMLITRTVMLVMDLGGGVASEGLGTIHLGTAGTDSIVDRPVTLVSMLIVVQTNFVFVLTLADLADSLVSISTHVSNAVQMVMVN